MLSRPPRNTYNCGGYALGTFSWYCPQSEEAGYYDWRFITKEEAWRKTLFAAAHMVLEFEGRLRVISGLEQLHKDERVVAFRLSSDGDFHYIKKGFNGMWYHKMGASRPIHHMTQKEVFETEWCDRYDGPIVLLAIKK